MSKYSPLWDYIKTDGRKAFTLSYDEIEAICGFPLDHSFLTYKKELMPYGYMVGKISMKNKTVDFILLTEVDSRAGS